MTLSPHFSSSMWPAPAQEAERLGAARSAMWVIGQARRRVLSASWAGPSGRLPAGAFGRGRLDRRPRYALRLPRPNPQRRQATQAAWRKRNEG